MCFRKCPKIIQVHIYLWSVDFIFYKKKFFLNLYAVLSSQQFCDAGGAELFKQVIEPEQKYQQVFILVIQLPGQLGNSNEILHVKCLSQCPRHSKHLINAITTTTTTTTTAAAAVTTTITAAAVAATTTTATAQNKLKTRKNRINGKLWN